MSDGISVLGKGSEHHLTVHEVFGASEADESDLGEFFSPTSERNIVSVHAGIELSDCWGGPLSL
jgi:hypothetical protein